jgi:ATP phosphoribosyltransferase
MRRSSCTFQPQQARSLADAHQELLQELIQQNQGQMKAEGEPRSAQVGARHALTSQMASPSPYQNAKEHDVVVLVVVQNQLQYFILIGPDSRWSPLQGYMPRR